MNDAAHRMLSCAELEAELSDYRDGTLAPERAAAVRVHLGGCPGCRDLAAAVARAQEQLRDLPEVEPPARLRMAILAQTSGPAHSGRVSNPGAGRLWQMITSPRFALGLAMSVFAFSLFLNAAQINLRQLSVTDLAPASVASAFQRQLDRTWARGVSYYHDLRVVVEIEAAIHQMRQTPAPPAGSPSGHDHSQSRPGMPTGAMMAAETAAATPPALEASL